MAKYNKSIANQIQNFMDANHYQYIFDKEKGIFKLLFSLPGNMKSTFMCIFVHGDCFSITATLSLFADPRNTHQMQQLAEFFCRTNENTLDGWFSLNYETGSIKYNCFRDCIQQLPSFATISYLVFLPLQMYLYYGAGLLSVFSSQKSPAEALRFCKQLHNPLSKGEKENETGDEISKETQAPNPEPMETAFPEIMEVEYPEELWPKDL